MKAKILTILFFLSVTTSFGQLPIEQKNSKKIVELLDSIGKIIKSLELLATNDSINTTKLSDSITKLKLQMQMQVQKNWEQQILEERLNQASETIEHLTSLVHGFGVIYAILTFLFTAIAIIGSILIYLLGIKPSQDFLKELKENIDTKIDTYLIKTRDIEIAKNIENLKSGNQERITAALNYLTFTQYQPFTEQQLFKLINILKFSNLDPITKGTIAYTISNQKSDFATAYFEEAAKEASNITIKYAAVKYFAIIGISNHLNIFRDILSKAINKKGELSGLLNYISNSSREAAKILLDDKELIDQIDDKDFQQPSGFLDQPTRDWFLSVNNWAATIAGFKETYFGKRALTGKII